MYSNTHALYTTDATSPRWPAQRLSSRPWSASSARRCRLPPSLVREQGTLPRVFSVCRFVLHSHRCASQRVRITRSATRLFFPVQLFYSNRFSDASACGIRLYSSRSLPRDTCAPKRHAYVHISEHTPRIDHQWEWIDFHDNACC